LAQRFNSEILEISNQFNEGGYKLNGTGMPRDVLYGDEIFLEKCEQGTFCSSFTFFVAYELIRNYKLIEFSNKDSLHMFQMEWYGSTPKSKETQCLYAMANKGICKKISRTQALPGDFVQFWRNNRTGHSVIFLAWVRDNKGEIIGINYRSSQKVTNGIGDRTEYFGKEKKEINKKRIYIARLSNGL
jgi:hypothetical protein